MADVLKHLETVRTGRAHEWWSPRSFTTLDAETSINLEYLDQYRLQLVSQVGFAVSNLHDGTGAFDMSLKVAKRQLVHHLYSEQLDIAHDLLHALYSGESREKVAERVSQLIESMTER